MNILISHKDLITSPNKEKSRRQRNGSEVVQLPCNEMNHELGFFSVALENRQMAWVTGTEFLQGRFLSSSCLSSSLPSHNQIIDKRCLSRPSFFQNEKKNDYSGRTKILLHHFRKAADTFGLPHLMYTDLTANSVVLMQLHFLQSTLGI